MDTYRTAEQANVRLVSLLAPEQVSPGETVEVIAVVESDRAAEVTLSPQGERNGVSAYPGFSARGGARRYAFHCLWGAKGI